LTLALVCRLAAAQSDLVSDLLATDESAAPPGLELPKPKPDVPPPSASAARQHVPVIEVLPADPEEAELTRQYNRLMRDLRGGMKFAEQAFVPDATFLPTDRDPLDVVLRRTASLLAHVTRLPGAPDLSARERELKELLDAAAKAPQEAEAVRRRLYFASCRLRRAIALANPLLNFGELLFLQRNGLGASHMCDQYYGQTQRPGGGICLLTDPFGPRPAARDLLTDSTVANGRLAGRKLAGTGSFLSPALSYDARRVAFAYVECEGEQGHRHHTEHSKGHWPEGWSYHLFSANLNGSDLIMLTDGTWNDFSPCFMPSGRIAFISERRGGYLRCGRVCPVYTLYDVAPDGSDVRCLSYHETNEWAPSVTHDGMLVWTRWDYVDRHGCVSHHPWLTTPDGRDPRPIHGSYSVRHERADMEMDVRSIPGSRRFVATAAPHHGVSFGSLVIVDPNIEDDDAMGPVRRLTPDVGFPESQGGGGEAAYGQAWPLSEYFYLCAYRSAGNEPYGLYLVDAFGNKELLFRAPPLNCLNPTPVRRVPPPPAIPEMARRVPEGEPAEATVTVVDAYRSLRPWPDGTKIHALRIYQIFPLSLPSATVFGRHETGPRIPQASDSINLARTVLGTVPVEDDGSAHFVVPARKELYFQALDAKGLAVTSMRAGTHFMPGERATCQGCHEPKRAAPHAVRQTTLLALRRAPSRIQPDVDGSAPICYPKLVQPVLDAKCVACHARNPDQAPPLDGSVAKIGGTDYLTSYRSLVQKYGFYSYPDYYRSTPGQFGARASKLYGHLSQGHKDVKLSDEEMHRITLWLDSVSLFYGVYEPEGQLVQLRGEIAKPTLE
jgi:hypothetical protein